MKIKSLIYVGRVVSILLICWLDYVSRVKFFANLIVRKLTFSDRDWDELGWAALPGLAFGIFWHTFPFLIRSVVSMLFLPFVSSKDFEFRLEQVDVFVSIIDIYLFLILIYHLFKI